MVRVEARLHDRDGRWLAFEHPARIIGTDSIDGVGPALAEVERLNRDLGLHAVGFVAYEAGAAYGLNVCPPEGDLPLVWFALFEPSGVKVVGPPRARTSYELGALRPSLSRDEFGQAFDRIKAHIAAGDTYQANFTFRMTGSFAGDPEDLFADLVAAQQGRYSTFIRIGDWAICSASPELFFDIDGVAIEARPMKGTARRGRTTGEDQRMRDQLRESAKQRAENVMIVDMMRNDMGRIAELGSVLVPEMFTVERYPNVWQMTSLVTARSIASYEDLFAAMFPSASVTGAPKIRTVDILTGLERSPRGVYTGAIGHIPPDGNGRFNVAIRTAIVDERAHTLSFGIGSGIVWDSDADTEYDECLLKGSVLGPRRAPFELLETMRWSPADGFWFLARHLERLRDSAEYFGIGVPESDIRACLDAAVAGETTDQRVRLLVGADGVRVERAPLVVAPGPLKVSLGDDPVDPSEVWLFHKTTNRQTYDRARASRPGVDDVLLWNPARELTEATTANVVVAVDGEQVTPPVACGLLAGTYRAELLARGEIRERIVTLDELSKATGLWLINSVYESRPAVVIDAP